MTAFRTRRLEASDEPQFNAAFNRFIHNTRRGSLRSLELINWVWHCAPGGETDSWLIEAQEDTAWKIVGHHALCPVRFTRSEEDWLCAKTVNTFLLQEFRDRFLYLRFERSCLEEVGHRLDATYSIGAGTARLRSALGYENSGTWIWLERGFQPLHLINRIAANLVGRLSYAARIRFSQTLAAISQVPERRSRVELVEHSSAEAISASFFADFWTGARSTAGMAPRRDPDDLAWRFWNRPGFIGTTFTCAWPCGTRAYFILNTGDPLTFALVDFFMSPPRPELLDRCLDELFVWCAERGALALRFWTTTDGLPRQLLEVFSCKMKTFQLKRFFPTLDLPRRLCPTGKIRAGGVLPPWNVTEFLRLDVP